MFDFFLSFPLFLCLIKFWKIYFFFLTTVLLSTNIIILWKKTHNFGNKNTRLINEFACLWSSIFKKRVNFHEYYKSQMRLKCLEIRARSITWSFYLKKYIYINFNLSLDRSTKLRILFDKLRFDFGLSLNRVFVRF